MIVCRIKNINKPLSSEDNTTSKKKNKKTSVKKEKTEFLELVF
jgi:hypothetical protein